MKNLKEILNNIEVVELIGNDSITINSIHFDSRKVVAGSLFIAIEGTLTDGHKYIEQAIKAGASAIICERLPDVKNTTVTFVIVKNSSFVLGIVASNFYGKPSHKIKLVGVTGTNGKTTVATILFKLVRNLGYKAGLISTIRNYIEDKVYPSTHTTPDPVQINALLHEMILEGCEFCFMEVSSHACVQGRINGLEFSGGVFTNITHDHLDYHKDFNEYIKAKQIFFNQLPENSFALVNVDDKHGLVMLQNTNARKFSYALKSMADFMTKIIESHIDGMLLRIDNKDLWVQFVGGFNAYNITAVYATAKLLGLNENEVLVELSNLKPVSGRFEVIRSENNISAIVDYAHTPDALKNVLETIHEINMGKGKIITVIGAGGNRDKSKRPLMAKIAVEYSDKVILTSDNPRFENPGDIISDMIEGIDMSNRKNVLKIIDRSEAIRTALMLAAEGDIVLVAGKGHETYQEVNGVKYHFDDHEIINETFNNQ